MTRRRRDERVARPEDGMSLVELIVVVLISAMLLGVIALIFGLGLATQQRQAARDAATGSLNAISATLNESMRSSVAARTADGRSRIDMKVLNEAGTGFECRAWKIQDERLWYSAGAGPRGAWSTGWAKLADNVRGPVGSPDRFGFTSDAGQSFSYALRLVEGDVDVVVDDGGVPGVKSELGGTACW